MAPISPQINPANKTHFRCKVFGLLTVEICRWNRALPVTANGSLEGVNGIPRPLSCRNCAQADVVDAGADPTLTTLAEILAGLPLRQAQGRRVGPAPVPTETPRYKSVSKPIQQAFHEAVYSETAPADEASVKRLAEAPEAAGEALRPGSGQAGPSTGSGQGAEIPPEGLEEAGVSSKSGWLTRPAHWSRSDVELLRREYPTADLDELARRLGRKKSAVQGKASQLGVRRRVPLRHKVGVRYARTPEIDAEIRRVYQQPQLKRGQVNALAKRIGWPRWAVSTRARSLGLTIPRFKEADWSERELHILQLNGWRSPLAIQARLKTARSRRTLTGIVLKRNRMHLTAKYLNGYSSRLLAEAFGIDSKTVTEWIERGWLKAVRRRSSRTPQQGGDTWWIKGKDVRAFIIGHAEMLDLGKVNRSWFVDILTGKAE